MLGIRALLFLLVAGNALTPAQSDRDRHWNLDGMVEDVRLVLEAVLRTADAAARPTWTEGDEFAARR